METKVIKMNQNEINNLRKKYQYCEINTHIQHTQFQIKGSDFTITVYNSGKVVFQAEDLSMHIKHDSPEKIDIPSDIREMSGSDEVGTGDYFGPVTVCAVYLTEDDYDKIPLDKIQDTKQMNDDLVMEVAPILIKQVKHSLLILNNRKYNEVQKTNNLNAIKAKLHNQAFVHLRNKYGLPKINIIDQFAPKDLYYRYLKGEKDIVDNLVFETKAENKFVAVACGAIIARYAFLQTYEKMNQKYDFEFPKGSGSLVDIKGKEFVERYGKDELINVAKVHFKNTEKILMHD